MQSWKSELRSWANQVAEEFQRKPGILGVVIGGSLARGQEWRHSDLELGLLVEERQSDMPYFNVIGGRGVEAIQLVRPDLEAQIALVENGDLVGVSKWPIQLWACRIMHDPTGLLERFKRQFDARLFTQEVVQTKLANLRQHVDEGVAEARGLLVEHKPVAALARARVAMNEAIQAAYWAHGELPRSQSRTDSRLRWLCREYDLMPFYDIYREVFNLSQAAKAIKRSWPKVKAQVLEITRLWGDSARDFFMYAVDGNFAWRQNAGILTVYRLYVPIIGAPEQGIFSKLDDLDWMRENPELMHFLGLEQATQESVALLLDHIEAGRRYF